MSKGQKHGMGTLVYEDGTVFKGSFRNDQRYGGGVMKFPDGSLYKGDFKDDKMNGLGTLFVAPNEIIECTFLLGKIADGKAKILFSNGEFFEGDFRKLKRNGKGIHYYLNGDIYDGDWSNDKRIGKGKVVFRDDSQLICQFIDDQADGHGVFQDKFGNSFSSALASDEEKSQSVVPTVDSGSIRNGKLFDWGKVKYFNEDRFKGCFKDGHPSGYGEMKYLMSLVVGGGEFDSGEYRGQWKAGKRHGQGLIKFEDGSWFDGLWTCNQRVEGKMRMANGVVYVGGFLGDKFHGQARLYMMNGLIFEGEFKQGICARIGKLLYPNGNVYFGQHRNFLKHGKGKMIYFNGDIYEGDWEQDRKSGKGRYEMRHPEKPSPCIGGGNLYIGDFQDDKKNGRGRLFEVDQSQRIYEGEF
eukprot:CAMPEP_0202966226 /NCGR_PEP_ID=MMETSP1396-20130829/10556_1 /ASSEMBLY_ACC=CAM_ASM_000872 /TAXON_ID= /ORGANISM="Pseudokeronopsis sp., Strain Brazil" /LENGTH=410 /DNA_ID=CAMNT_0049689845 /DNA_START=508 /DNA_END=1740 /DNA_ORIENTATION=-